MAYVRQRGNQLALVHGERDPQTKKVAQKTLFTIYSRPEALEAIGRGSSERRGTWFRELIANRYPGVKFDWKKIDKQILDLLDVLPESYEYRAKRLQERFRTDLVGFTRQLLISDPQSLFASSQLIKAQRHELEFLQQLIEFRLRTCEQEENEWNKGDPFHWIYTLQGSDVPPDAQEMVAGLHHRDRNLEAAKAIYQHLIEGFEGYADGHHGLGTIALDQGRCSDGVDHFEKCVEISRKTFPRRIPKDHWWSLLETRPYIRGLFGLAHAYNRLAQYEEALEIADRLERECHMRDRAEICRTPVFLNTGRWREALVSARYLQALHPSDSVLAAFAAYELGDKVEATTSFIHSAMNVPRAVGMCLGLSADTDPEGRDEIQDHNAGVEFQRVLRPYLEGQSKSAQHYFRQLLQYPMMLDLIEQRLQAQAGHSASRDVEDARQALEELHHLGSYDFAQEQAERVLDS